MNKLESNLTLTLPGRITAVSLDLRPGLTFEEWSTVGKKISRLRQACHWWIGDWLNYGEFAYGETYAQAMDETEYAYDTLAHDKSVASHIEFRRRRKNLSWSHHAEVAALDPVEQDKLLDLAVKYNWTRDEMRTEAQVLKEKKKVLAGEALTARKETEPINALVPAKDGFNGTIVHLAILVECSSVDEQNSLLERFVAEGLRCRAYSD